MEETNPAPAQMNLGAVQFLPKLRFFMTGSELREVEVKLDSLGISFTRSGRSGRHVIHTLDPDNHEVEYWETNHAHEAMRVRS